jgi:large subunit ribosomal protein L24
MRLKKGDKVVVLSGVDKGKEGRILFVLPEKDRVIVEGIRMVKRHTKPSQQNQAGGIIEKESAIHVSKLAFVDPTTGEKTKLSVKVVDGKRLRMSKTTGEVV